jgi:hypothetical protein
MKASKTLTKLVEFTLENTHLNWKISQIFKPKNDKFFWGKQNH